jgi:branched-chain amino acid transport system ATP-binding protein
MSACCLAVRNVAKRFGSLIVLDDVSFEVAPGERRGILGPNGAGKSTLFNIIAGEIPLTSGSIEVLGRDVSRLPVHSRARLGVARTFQTTTLFPRLTVLENLMLALQASSRARFQCVMPLARYGARRDEAHSHLENVDLASLSGTLVDALSYGEKRQIEILLALAQQPALLLLDEPTAGLAPADAQLVTDMLKRQQRSMTMVLIEHDMGVMFDVVERLMVLHHGHVVADGPIDEVRADPNVQEVYLGGKL